MQLWEAQKIKQVSDSPVISPLRWSYTSCGHLTAWGWCRALCSVHTGHHSSWHRREDLHAISNVRYDLRWRSLPDVLKLLRHLSVFLHRKSFLGLCRLCTIWNTDCKSHIKLIHFNHACRRSWLDCATAHSHSHVWGWLKWDFGLILPQNKLLFPRSHLGHWSSSPKSDSGFYHYMAGTVKTQPIVKPLHLL